MTKEEALQFKTRWKLVNQARVEEVRLMSPVEKIKDLEMLFEFGEKLRWHASTAGEGWQCWARLKELASVKR